MTRSEKNVRYGGTRGMQQRQLLNRFLYRDGGWYVAMREDSRGPFARREDAEQFLAHYLRTGEGL